MKPPIPRMLHATQFGLAIVLCALVSLGAIPVTFAAEAEAKAETEAATDAKTSAVNIGLSMHFMRDDYAMKVVDSVEAVVLQHPGSSLSVTDANGTAQKQLADMENLLVQKVGAIIVIPIDEKAILPAIRKANEQGIPVVAITHIPNAQVLTTVASAGDYANGFASGELLREKLNGAGKVATIGLPYNLWRIDERVRGFEDAIKDSAIEIVARQASDDQAKVQDLVAGILTAHPDLAGIWVTFSNQLVGAADALRSAQRKGVVLTGIDADQAIIERIRRGWITGAAAQFPREHGTLAAEAVYLHFAGETVPATYEVPVGLVTVENADEMEERIWSE